MSPILKEGIELLRVRVIVFPVFCTKEDIEYEFLIPFCVILLIVYSPFSDISPHSSGITASCTIILSPTNTLSGVSATVIELFSLFIEVIVY